MHAANAVDFGASENAEKTMNKQVKNDAINNLRTVAQKRAIDLADSGKPMQAAQELRANSELLKYNGAVNNDTQLLTAAELLDQQADEIGAQGMNSKIRKQLKADNWQSQQSQYSF